MVVCEGSAPLVTVVTVTRNAEALIERTIESVCSQDYRKIEYIIVDGNSDDNTVNIINKYLHGISQFISEPDEGIYHAMNKGLRRASPESQLITFLNAGDKFFNSAVIRNVVATALKSDAHIYGNILRGKTQINTHEKITLYNLATKTVNHQAFFLKTAVHRHYFYDTRFKAAADYKLLIDLAYAGERFEKIQMTIANTAPNGFCHRNKELLAEEKKTIRRMYFKIRLYNIIKRNHRRLSRVLLPS